MEREVEFCITGMINRYKGLVVKEKGHNNYPEIKVTHVKVYGEDWKPSIDWPLLKDGDYILL